MAEHDAVIVGSGINSLACAALLSRAGWDVCVLERESELGGAIKTAELTEPGGAVAGQTPTHAAPDAPSMPDVPEAVSPAKAELAAPGGTNAGRTPTPTTPDVPRVPDVPDRAHGPG